MDSKFSETSFGLPVVIGVFLTPVCLIITLQSAGIGHGSYEPMLLMYPFSLGMLQLQFSFGMDSIFGSACIALAVIFGLIQFPVYGLVVGLANISNNGYLAAGKIGVYVHLAIVIALVFISVLAGAISFYAS